MTDEALEQVILQAKQKEPEACSQLFDVLEPMIFAYVAARVSDHETARDLTQDALIAIFLALGDFHFQGKSAWFGFVFTIVKRKLAKHYKRQVGRQLTTFDEMIHSPGQDQVVGLNLDIDQALNTLDEVSRDIVLFHHWFGMTFGEVGDALNMNENAVRTRYHRTKDKLAKLLDL